MTSSLPVAQDGRRGSTGSASTADGGLLRRARRGRRRPRAARGARHLRHPRRGRARPGGRDPVRRVHLPRPGGALRDRAVRLWARERAREDDFDHPDVVARAARADAAAGRDLGPGRDGTVHPVDRPVVALCRCEKSSRLPWCDGTHKVIPRRSVDRPLGDDAGSARSRWCHSAARAALAPAAPCTPPPGCADAEPRKRPGTPVAARPRIAGTGRKTSSWWSWDVPPLTAPPTRLALRASSSCGPSTRRAPTRSPKPGARASMRACMRSAKRSRSSWSQRPVISPPASLRVSSGCGTCV